MDVSGRLVALEDVLAALTEAGPLSTDEFADRLGLYRLDARVVLLDAHASGLVQTTGRGEWVISDRGREALVMQAGPTQSASPSRTVLRQGRSLALRLRASLAGYSWRSALRPGHLGPHGVALTLALLVGVAGVAVASGRVEIPPIATDDASTITKPPVHIRHHARRHRTSTAPLTGTDRYLERSTLTAASALVRRPRGRHLREDRLLAARGRGRREGAPVAPVATRARRSTHRFERAPSRTPVARKHPRARPHRGAAKTRPYRTHKVLPGVAPTARRAAASRHVSARKPAGAGSIRARAG